MEEVASLYISAWIPKIPRKVFFFFYLVSSKRVEFGG